MKNLLKRPVKVKLIGGGGHAVGEAGERAAARYLINRGYFILKRNHTSRYGELDLVCEAPDKRTVVFVEVKTAEVERDARFAPELRVGAQKQQKITALAAAYLRREKLVDRPARFDVIGVTLKVDGDPEVRHHTNAFASPW